VIAAFREISGVGFGIRTLGVVDHCHAKNRLAFEFEIFMERGSLDL
jgi:hypothetical protein